MIAGLAIAAFASSFGGDFVSDDRALITQSSEDVADVLGQKFWDVGGGMRGTGLYTHVYRPMSQALVSLERKLFGDEPAGFHLVNLLLHAATSLLVLGFLERRLRTRESDGPSWAALLGAMLFAVHPSHAESVAWISGSTDLLMAFFWLLGLELLSRRSVPFLIAGFCMLVLAMLSKEPVVMAPVLCLVDAWSRDELRAERRSIVVCAAAIVTGLAVLYGGGLAGAASGGHTLPAPLAAVTLLGLYLAGALFPTRLTFQSQPFVLEPDGVSFPALGIALGVLCMVALVGLVVLSLRSARGRPWLADLLWFVLPLLPVVLLLWDVLSDRFLYVATLGVISLGSRGLAHALSARTPALRQALTAVAVLLVVAWLPLSVRASQAFLTNEALWRSQIEARPDLAQPRDSLGQALIELGQFDEAQRQYESGLARASAVGQRSTIAQFVARLVTWPVSARPEWDTAAMTRAREGCVNLLEERRATYGSGASRVDLALSEAEAARLAGNAEVVVIPCARAMLAAQDLPRALALARRAVALRSRTPAALELLVLANARAGRFEDALAQLAQAERLGGALPELRQRVQGAHDLSRKARPRDARERALLSAQLSFMLSSPEAARRALAPALAEQPTDHELVRALAQSYVTERRFLEAERALSRARDLAPADPYWGKSLAALEDAMRKAEAQDRGR